MHNYIKSLISIEIYLSVNFTIDYENHKICGYGNILV